MKDYNIQLKVRNNLLLEKMRSLGHETAASLSRASGVSQTDIGAYLNLKKAPISIVGVSPTALKLCDTLFCELEDIFPDQHLYIGLDNNKAEVTVSENEVCGILGGAEPDGLIESSEEKQALFAAIESLTGREKYVVEKRHGINDSGVGATLVDIAKDMDISIGRVRQIEAKAIRKMRSPSSEIRQYLYDKT